MAEISETTSTSLSSIDISTDGSEEANDTSGDFSCLSDEVLLEILHFLDTRSLCRCSQVNIRFRNVLQDLFVYTTLNLNPYWRIVTDKVLDLLTPQCRQLRRLVLTNCGNNGQIAVEAFKNFLNVCGHSLTYLDLHSAHFVNDSIMEEISLICRNLRDLKLSSDNVTNNGFKCLEKLDSLESLNIFSGSIETPTLIQILRKNCKMKHLHLSGINHIDADAVAAKIPDLCPYMESLDFAGTAITGRGLKELARCVNLREINIAWCNRIFDSKNADGAKPERALKTLFGSCVRLETVNLKSVFYVTDEDLEPLLLCPIKQLNMSDAEFLDADMCSRFFSSWPGLQKITLRDCLKINEADVREWQDRYPHVSIDFIPYCDFKIMVCRRKYCKWVVAETRE